MLNNVKYADADADADADAEYAYARMICSASFFLIQIV